MKHTRLDEETLKTRVRSTQGKNKKHTRQEEGMRKKHTRREGEPLKTRGRNTKSEWKKHTRQEEETYKARGK